MTAINTSTLRIVVGMGIVYGCFWYILFGDVFPPTHFETMTPLPVDTLVIHCSMLALFLGACFFPMRGSRAVLAIASILCSLCGIALFLISALSITVADLWAYAAMAIMGISCAYFLICWFESVSTLGYRDIQVTSALGIGFGGSLCLMLMSLGRSTSLVLLVLLLGVQAYLFKKYTDNAPHTQESSLSITQSRMVAPVGLLLCIFVVATSNGLLRGVGAYSSNDGGALIFSAVAAGCIIIAYLDNLKISYALSIVVLTIGLYVLPTALHGVGYSLIGIGQIGIMVVTWIMCAALAKKNNAKRSVVFGFVWLFVCAGQIAGNVLGAMDVAFDQPDMLGFVASALILCCLIVLAFTMNKPFLSVVKSELYGVKQRDDYSRKVEAMKDRFALTSRERQVFELLAYGKSSKYIEEELTIAANTVKAHTRNIYQKMGISSKQELLELIDEYDLEASLD